MALVGFWAPEHASATQGRLQRNSLVKLYGVALSMLRLCEQIIRTHNRRIDDVGAAVTIARSSERRRHVIAEQCDAGGMCTVSDAERAA
jgi:hypothetical protein